jgi:hypothetical protein
LSGDFTLNMLLTLAEDGDLFIVMRSVVVCGALKHIVRETKWRRSNVNHPSRILPSALGTRLMHFPFENWIQDTKVFLNWKQIHWPWNLVSRYFSPVPLLYQMACFRMLNN